MTKLSFPSDTIALKISTGGNSAANGGSGHNSGNISSTPTISFDPSNKAYGSDVHVTTGDKVSQKADWDAGGANATTTTQATKMAVARGTSASGICPPSMFARLRGSVCPGPRYRNRHRGAPASGMPDPWRRKRRHAR